MKLAVTGKGGAGKTTLAAGLALLFAEEGKKVIALDCDPDMNLGVALGFPHPEKIQPISQMKELIAERTQINPEGPKGYFKLNPRVDDIPEKFSLEYNNVRLMVMGKVDKAGSGCLCPENTFIKNLISHLVVNRSEVVMLDMVAGSEHLGRATAGAVDIFLIIVEPTILGVNTALHIQSLAQSLGLKKIFFAGNKIMGGEDIKFLEDNLKEKITGFISFNQIIQRNRGRFEFDAKLKEEFRDIYLKLKGEN